MADVARRLILDETGLLLQDAEAASRLLEDFAVFVENCRSVKRERISKWSGIYEATVVPGFSLCDLIYSETDIVDNEVRHLLREVIDRCSNWDDEPGAENVDPSVEVAGQRSTAYTLAFIHHERLHGRIAAAVVLRRTPVEPIRIAVRARDVTLWVHRVFDERSLREFYRAMFELAEVKAGDDFMSLCPFAFPDLYFHPELAQQLRCFETEFRDLRPDLVYHLAVLNDRFKEIHADCQGMPDEVSKRIAAERVEICEEVSSRMSSVRVEMSGESPKTRRNQKAMKERNVTVLDENGARHQLSCELHTKLRPSCDRVHFHAGRQGLLDGRVIVGIFAAHLTI